MGQCGCGTVTPVGQAGEEALPSERAVSISSPDASVPQSAPQLPHPLCFNDRTAPSPLGVNYVPDARREYTYLASPDPIWDFCSGEGRSHIEALRGWDHWTTDPDGRAGAGPMMRAALLALRRCGLCPSVSREVLTHVPSAFISCVRVTPSQQEPLTKGDGSNRVWLRRSLMGTSFEEPNPGGVSDSRQRRRLTHRDALIAVAAGCTRFFYCCAPDREAEARGASTPHRGWDVSCVALERLMPPHGQFRPGGSRMCYWAQLPSVEPAWLGIVLRQPVELRQLVLEGVANVRSVAVELWPWHDQYATGPPFARATVSVQGLRHVRDNPNWEYGGSASLVVKAPPEDAPRPPPASPASVFDEDSDGSWGRCRPSPSPAEDREHGAQTDASTDSEEAPQEPPEMQQDQEDAGEEDSWREGVVHSQRLQPGRPDRDSDGPFSHRPPDRSDSDIDGEHVHPVHAAEDYEEDERGTADGVYAEGHEEQVLEDGLEDEEWPGEEQEREGDRDGRETTDDEVYAEGYEEEVPEEEAEDEECIDEEEEQDEEAETLRGRLARYVAPACPAVPLSVAVSVAAGVFAVRRVHLRRS
eukprot:TRINITY_DN60308_c0_g1_i1.p1 TRINITY_DN60308_c0_g1~~TRINITY_DN60308_c0_g1_i1.p1  ORF type:complete len:585 (+),score=99.91 TRINITY_DN60308_c0_g1_i1:89-1843(+)